MGTRRSVSVNWAASSTCYTKEDGTELGGIEGAESGFSQEKYWLGQSKNIKRKKPTNPKVLHNMNRVKFPKDIFLHCPVYPNCRRDVRCKPSILVNAVLEWFSIECRK